MNSNGLDKSSSQELVFEFDDFHGDHIGRRFSFCGQDENNNVGISKNLSNLEVGDEGVLVIEESKVNLSNFKILNLVGQGGYGKVYQVVKTDTKEIFAMKSLKKDSLVKHNNVEYTKTERDILRKVRHPFIVSLHYAFQNESNVYLVMDFVNGGQILYHLREQAMFSENLVKFYAAEVVLALEHLHSLDIIHRDLKPENVILDCHGHISLTDFGFAKESINDQNRANTFCGTIAYMSPEMIQGKGYGKSTDWWSVGILIYDMLMGDPPFNHKNDAILQKKIVGEKYKVLPNYLGSETHSIVKGLLTKDETKRLGSGPNGINDIKKHQFFKNINWKKLLNKEIDPPFRPPVEKGLMDIKNFDEDFTKQVIGISPSVSKISKSQDALFKGFSYARTPTDYDSSISNDDEEVEC